MLDMGAVVASIDLNASSFISNANKAKTAADSLNGAGAGALVQTESRLDAISAKLDSIGGKLMGFGTKMTAAVTLPLLGIGGIIVKSAASSENAMGKVDSVFDDSAGTIKSWSETTASSLGISQTAALQAAGTFGSFYRSSGLALSQSADMSKELVGLSADVSAFNDVSQDRASEAIMSGLAGEYDSLQRLGVNINAAKVEQEALSIATADGRTEVTDADVALARHNVIMRESSLQHGQFAKESDSMNGQLAIMKAEVADAAVGFGKLLIPAMTKALRGLTKLVHWVDELSPGMRKLAIGVGGVAAAIGPLSIGLGAVLKGFGPMISMVKLLGTGLAILASPIGLVVLAIAALAAGAIYAYTHFEPFREAVDKVAAALKDFAENAIEKVVAAWKKLTEAFDADGWSGVWDTIVQAVQDGLKSILTAFQNIDWGAVGSVLLTGLLGALSWLAGIGGSIWSWVSNAVTGIDWGSVWNGVVDATGVIVSKLGDLGSAIWSWVWTAVGNIDWTSVWNGVVDVTAAIVGKLGDLGLALGVWFYGAVSGVDWAGIFMLGINALAQVGMWIIGLIGDLTLLLIPAGQQAISGLWNGAMIAWGWVSAWLATIGVLAIAAVGSLVATLVARGKELFTGLWNGILAAWASVSAWLGTVGTLVNGAVGSLIGTLVQRGKDAMAGLWNGLLAMWASVSGWLSGLGGLIAGAVGDMSGALVGAGLSIMSGLKSGLVSGWNDITGWLSGLNPADWKGPEARDRKMLYKPGLWIMDGLAKGLDEGWGDVTRQLAGFRPELALAGTSIGAPSVSNYRSLGAMSVPARVPTGGSTVHNHYHQSTEVRAYALNATEMERLLKEIDYAPEKTIRILNEATHLADATGGSWR